MNIEFIFTVQKHTKCGKKAAICGQTKILKMRFLCFTNYTAIYIITEVLYVNPFELKTVDVLENT